MIRIKVRGIIGALLIPVAIGLGLVTQTHPKASPEVCYGNAQMTSTCPGDPSYVHYTEAQSHADQAAFKKRADAINKKNHFVPSGNE